MMRKNIKTGLIAFGMCLALPFCSFAAVKNPEKAEGREERAQIHTELASYREVLDSNTKELSDLISEKKALIDEVKEAIPIYTITKNKKTTAKLWQPLAFLFKFLDSRSDFLCSISGILARCF